MLCYSSSASAVLYYACVLTATTTTQAFSTFGSPALVYSTFRRPSCSFSPLLQSSPNPDDTVSLALKVAHTGSKLLKEIAQGSANETKKEKEDAQRKVDLELESIEREQEQEKSKKETKKSSQSNKSKQPNSATTTVKTDQNSTKLDQMQQELDELFQTKLQAFHRNAHKTRIVLLRKVASWAFDVSCDNGNQNQGKKIDRATFYTGTLLVHLHLAKYVGVAACQPPTREQTDELFTLADADGNSFLSKEEFTSAVLVATAPMASRIAVYWTLLALLPLLVTHCMTTLTRVLLVSNQKNRDTAAAGIFTVSSATFGRALAIVEFILQLILSRIFFSLLLPNIFARIDRAARCRALKRSRRQKANTTLWWLRTTSSSSSSSANKQHAWASGFRQPFWPYRDTSQREDD